ncbi:MAG: metallophosphoesterase [Sediminicola sp.]
MMKHYVALCIIVLLSGCATSKLKYADPSTAKDVEVSKEVAHTFYLIGDAGLSPMGGMNPVLKIFRNRLSGADKNSTAIFLGDNIYPAGLPDPKDSTVAYRTAINHLDAQLNTLDSFKGRTLFIPGNHDWYTEGLIGLEREQDYIVGRLGSKDVFQPRNGCPLEEIEINDDLVVLAIDTEWYLTNWDKRPSINDKCEIKSRNKFLEELEGLIKKHGDKTTILAMHHPLFSYGAHGGQSTWREQFYPGHTSVPIPILGSIINIFRKTTGASVEDLNNKRYRELRKRIGTLAQYSEKVIVASGHEHTLQYIVEENIPQILSGAGAKRGGSRLLNGSLFSTGEMGFATLEVYADGSSRVRYFGLDGEEREKFLFTAQVLPPDREKASREYPTSFPKQVEASIYTEEEIDKSNFFKGIWGERYRNYYAAKVAAPTVLLDTLFGGLTPVRKGGGHQSKSLRLEDKDGKQYVMRALRKSAELYLQSMAFKDQYIVGDFANTYTEDLLMDFYTGSHPYAPFAVATLSKAVGVYHTNPELYYVPKQQALMGFDDDFGDELYMIEEHVGDGHGDLESFGYAEKIESTDDLLKKLRKDEDYVLDAEGYLRARLFDMVLGDWDRHSDQWRWAETEDKETGSTVFRPIPRDRDQVFSIMGDGALMKLATRTIPPLRLMEGFNEEIRNVRGFNINPYPMDMSFLSGTTRDQWLKEVAFIQQRLTPEVIDSALEQFPPEVRDSTVAIIKRKLLSRLRQLPQVAAEYYDEMNTFAVIKGTDKDDWFEIGITGEYTEVSAYRIIGGNKEKMYFQKRFYPSLTREIWIYGLDDDDYFVVKGKGKNGIKVRLVGGQNNDVFDIEDGKQVVVYDYESKENTIKSKGRSKVVLTDDYEINTYEPLKLKSSTNQLIPTVGYNPDDGVKLGFSHTYIHNGFIQDPFTSRHRFNAAYYFATNGFELGYQGEFARLDNWNVELAARFTSPNFSINFFGFGNGTENLDDELDLDYNRVKIQTSSFSPSLVHRGPLGSVIKAGIGYERLEVEETEDRFINTFYQANGAETTNQFVGANLSYGYSNQDSPAFPTLGMSTALDVGYKRSADDGGQSFGYVVPSLSLDYKLVPDGRLVLATKWKAHFNIGDDYEFYQAASIGGVDGLRGFRNQRFTGKTAYYQNTDIRYSLKRKKTGFLPMSMGVFGGFDYGRVWFPGDGSDQWHNSYGGGFFLNGADIMSLNLALFNSEEGPRFTFGLGFGF